MRSMEQRQVAPQGRRAPRHFGIGLVPRPFPRAAAHGVSFVATIAPVLIVLGLAGIVQAQPLTDSDLLNKVFMHGKTFENSGSGGWARDDIEIEGVFGLSGLDAKTLYHWLRAAPGTREALRGSLFSDANNYRELRRSSSCEAFSIGFPIDEIPWDTDRHKVREASPLIWMTIESDRFAVDERKNKRVLSLGTDLMDDIYYDTREYTLLGNDMTIRSRKRWDSATEARRILIGLKRDGDVDGSGLKAVAKTDIRNDGASAAEIAQLDSAIRGGFTEWGTKEPAVPVRELYERLKVRGVLPSTVAYKDVLLLEPKIFVRSVRSRYHLDETRLEQIQTLHALGMQRVDAILKLLEDAKTANAVPVARAGEVADFLKKVAGIKDRTLIAERAKKKLLAIDPSMDVTAASIAAFLPTAPELKKPETIADLVARKAELEKRRAVAEAVSELYHELALNIEGATTTVGMTGAVSGVSNPESIRRIATMSLDQSLEAYVELFADWQRAKDPKANGPKTTYDPFVAIYETIKANDAERAAFNAYGDQQKAANVRKWRNFKALDAKGWEGLGPQLKNEMVRIWSRQIEAAGSAALGLWFDQARAFYVPASSRSWGNFIIDTMDFTSIYTADAAFTSGPDPKPVDAGTELDESKLIHTVLVNEGQIELTSVGAYTRRLSDLGNGHERARTFMKWAEVAGLASSSATFQKLQADLARKGDDALKADVTKLNEFARSNGAKAFELDDLRGIPAVLLTDEIKNGATDPTVDVAFQGAKFVLDQYRDFLKYLSRLKQDKVFSVLKDAREPGTPEPNLGWSATTGGKGETGLAILKEKFPPVVTPVTPAGPTLDESLAGADNHAAAKAAAVEKKGYGKLDVAAGETDWFKLAVKKGETVTVTIKFDHANGAGDLTLGLYRYRNARTYAISSSRTTNNEETLTFKANRDETIHIRVRGATGAAKAAYTLEVK